MTKKKKKESWKEKRRRAALKHQKAVEAERLRRKREPRKRKGLTRSKVLGIGFLVLIVLVIGVFATLQNTQPSNADEPSSLYTLTDADFGEFTGKVVVIDCFATWCGPCVGEIPHLTEIVNNYNNSEVAVISVGSSSDSEIGLSQFKKDYNMDWLVASDTVGVFNKYGVQAIPTVIILDQTGNIHYQHVGLAEASILSSKINELLSD